MARIVLFFFTILFSVLQPKFASASDLIPAKQKYSSTTATFSNHFQLRNLNFDPYFIEFEDEEVNENENENFSFEKKANANFSLNYLKSFEKKSMKSNCSRLFLHQKRYLFILLNVFRL